MAHDSRRIFLHAVAVCPVLAVFIGCGQSNAGSGDTSNGGALLGGSSSLSSGGTTANGGSGKSNTSASGGYATTSATGGVTGSGGVVGTGGSNSAGYSGMTGGAASGGAGTGGRSGGGNSATGGASEKGGGSAQATTSGGTSAGGATSKGGTSSSSTGGESTGGTSSSSTGGASKGGSNATSAGGASGGASGGTSSTSTAGATSTNVTIVPDSSWACGMASGIPEPTLGALVFHATLKLGDTHDVGTTQYGHRRVIDVQQSSFTSDRLNASFLTGGLELELTLSNGVLELEEIDVLKATDGTLIYLHGCGMAPAGDTTVRVVPDFEVATSNTNFAWLNSGKFVGARVLDTTANTIALDVYDISNVTVGGPQVQITVPTGVATQPVACATASGSKGASVFTESVTLDSTLAIGASKRGTRNIIPITGGTVTGSSFTGTVLSGGGDYQLTPTGSSTTILDARYTLKSNDDYYVVVTNCGPMGALVPQFETSTDGPYSFLNSNTYLSSDPSSASGGVSITFYKRQ